MKSDTVNINQDRRQQMLLISQLHIRPQVRCHMDPEEMASLEKSIHEQGILQPLTVSPIGGDNYMIIAGHRRFQAARKIGLKQVPVFIRQGNMEDMRSLQATENLVRCNLNALERTESLMVLFCSKFEMSQDQACIYLRRLRRNLNNDQMQEEIKVVSEFFRSYNVAWVSYVSADIRNLSLPSDLKDACRNHGLDVSKARELSRVTDAALRREITNSILNKKMSLKETREEIGYHLPPRRNRRSYALSMSDEFNERLRSLPEARQKMASRLLSQLGRLLSQPTTAGAQRIEAEVSAHMHQTTPVSASYSS